MKYNFFIQTNEQHGWKYVRVHLEDDIHAVLKNITFSDNLTPNQIQTIIHGIQGSKTPDVRYEWANEDIHIAAFSEGVFLFDLLARRAGVKKEGADLQLTHEELIQFLQDFKRFVEENT